MKIIFMGTPEFAIPSLEMLINNGYYICSVVTQPDKPKGRNNKLSMSPIKVYSQKKSIPILQPLNWKSPEYIQQLKAFSPDLFITAAYGKILPKEVLAIPKLGCINVHASLLPSYRGAAPINWAIINGEKITGITTMWTDVGMDTGDIIIKNELEIGNETTAGELTCNLSILGAQVLQETLQGLENGNLTRIPQENSKATYAPMLTKDIAQIQWIKTSTEIHNFIRGLNPNIGAYTFLNSKRIKIWKAKPIEDSYILQCNKNQEPGNIIKMPDGSFSICCGEGMLNIFELQPESGKRMSAKQFSIGHNIEGMQVI